MEPLSALLALDETTDDRLIPSCIPAMEALIFGLKLA